MWATVRSDNSGPRPTHGPDPLLPVRRLSVTDITGAAPVSVTRAGLFVGVHRQDGSERGDQQTQQEQHIHRVPSRDVSAHPSG